MIAHTRMIWSGSRAILLAVVGALALMFSVAPLAGAQGANAMVRVVHASPDAPAVDVYVGGNRALSNVPFGAVSDYLSVPAGSAAIKVLPAGAPAGDRGVIEATVNLQAGTAYTVAAAGRLADIRPVVITDNLSAPASGQAKVRLVHLSPDAPAVDVAVANGPVLIRNIAFPNAADYVQAAAGTYNLQVRVAGQNAVALSVPDVTLEAGNTYTAFALGLAQGQPALMAKLTMDAGAGAMPGMPGAGAGGMANQAPVWPLAVAGAALVALGAVLAMRRRATE